MGFAFSLGRRWDEMGLYDIPAELNYILKKTGGQKLIYIGHSMGVYLANAIACFSLVSYKYSFRTH